jgi:hypothetical protein
MIHFVYCPIVGLKYWEFRDVLKNTAPPTTHYSSMTPQSKRMNKSFKTQHKQTKNFKNVRSQSPKGYTTTKI